jgi:hypothetical protein
MNGDGSSSSPYEISTASDLQAMQEDLSAHYKLIRNIDASETENWNEKTSDEFSIRLENGWKTGLNYVASESTINVVNKSGVDVTFTSNAGNDSITIDDTYYDSNSEKFTISYDLATPINQGFDPVGTSDSRQANSEFTGSFDGQNHTISNLSINRVNYFGLFVTYAGLFGKIGAGGEVKNVGVINVNMTGGQVGSLAALNSGNISNSYSTGNVTSEGFDVGGLVGVNYGNISNSYSTGNVSNEEFTVGGLVGYNYEGNISNSYSTGNVTGLDVGGLVGYNYEGNISNSYSTGNVSGEDVGGLLEGAWGGSVSDSYWDINSTGQSSSVGLDSNGLTTSEMQGSSAKDKMDFDFTSTWSTVEGDYPELQWQE